jgi:hypothetical protein
MVISPSSRQFSGPGIDPNADIWTLAGAHIRFDASQGFDTLQENFRFPKSA